MNRTLVNIIPILTIKLVTILLLNLIVTSVSAETAPDQFSMEWLNGKTLYAVWYGTGNDAEGNEIYNAAIVQKEVYNNGVFTSTNILNSLDYQTTYAVDDKGLLYGAGNSNNGSRIVCGSTS